MSRRSGKARSSRLCFRYISRTVQLSDFDYELPHELIAQRPLPDRAGARMLVLHRRAGNWEDRSFCELPDFLGPGDCLALNDTRVFPSRLFGRRAGVHALPVSNRNPKSRENLSGQVQVFLIRPTSADGLEWEALVRPGRKMRSGEIIRLSSDLEAEIIARGAFGQRTIRFNSQANIYEQLEKIGHVPLPPYIRRPDEPEDRERYQTVFARVRGSVAAPTASLHFTPEVLQACRAAGADIAYVTLHIGLGTFQPIRGEHPDGYRLHSESYEINEENAARMRSAQRIVAVGTTSVRTLETVLENGEMRAAGGETDLFIRPGFHFRGTGAMLTNFHLPRSSLLMLVCAFAGTDFVLQAYRHAVHARYRFYSYGDCMLIV